MMMEAYRECNQRLAEEGKPQYFVVDLCRPGHLDDCLKMFMNSVGAERDNWDANFAENWTSNDLADCILSFAINDMMRRVVTGSPEGAVILKNLEDNPRSATQFLLLAHLYTREDNATLATLRHKLLPFAFPTVNFATSFLKFASVGVALAAIGWMAGSSSLFSDNKSDAEPSPVVATLADAVGKIPHPRASLSVAVTGSVAVFAAVMKRTRDLESLRARELCGPVRIASPRADMVEKLLNSLFSTEDYAERIRGLHIGRSAQQKLELIESLCKACGFEGLAVFGDCFDEVGLLDPLMFPSALKIFAREVCKNEILNQGRFHFFFPDARASLDLSTDRIVREARFDRHFVRDVNWSRFQLEDLAERRFIAAQHPSSDGPKFQELFAHVSKEDFSGAISKLHTPRELMVFMTELLARVEATNENGTMVTAQDMEIAVKNAQQQSV